MLKYAEQGFLWIGIHFDHLEIEFNVQLITRK